MSSSELTTLFPPYWVGGGVGRGGEIGALGHGVFDRIYSCILSLNGWPLQVSIFLCWRQMMSMVAALIFERKRI